MTKINQYILPAIVLGLGFSFGAGPASAGVSCKAMVWGNGLHSSKMSARAMARHSWKIKAGPGWNNTSLAQKKSKGCRLDHSPRKHGANRKKWNCVYQARPCKKLGLSY